MVNVLYNEYVDDLERDFDVDFMKESVKLDRVMLSLKAIVEKEELDIREAEIRCMEESADMNTLESYYKEATEEVAEKKTGLIQKAWAVIQSIFKKIHDFFVGSPQKKALEEAAKNGEEIEVDAEGNEIVKSTKEMKQIIGDNPDKLVDAASDKTKRNKILAIIGVVVGGAGIAVASDAVHRYKAGEINGLADYLTIISDKVSKFTNGFGKIVSKFSQEVSDIIHKVGEFFKKALAKLCSFVKKKTTPKTEEEKAKEKKEQEKKKKEEKYQKERKDFNDNKSDLLKDNIRIDKYDRKHDKTKRISEVSNRKRRKAMEEIKLLEEKFNKDKEISAKKKRQYGMTNKEFRERRSAILAHYHIKESEMDIVSGDVMYETVDDSYMLPEEMIQEAGMNDILEISDLLDTI